MQLIQPIVLMFWSFSLIFLYCESGEFVSIRFDGINDSIFESDWHLLPHDFQKMLPIILNVTEKPVTISGFGNIALTRDTFKKVLLLLLLLYSILIYIFTSNSKQVTNSGFTYFMIFRQFAIWIYEIGQFFLTFLSVIRCNHIGKDKIKWKFPKGNSLDWSLDR